ncbi:hypothetical protein ACRN9C_18010 [Shewanella frigidimarina]|uniref:hypothetical protein n=1 Tax=Shewanella frigidimarina TaxID=56812 RepID=UPI003D7B1675
MNKTIEVSNLTYQRLENMARGFSDVPDSVITRLLDLADGRSSILVESKPDLFFIPKDEEHFKRLLIRDAEAEVVLYKNDGTREVLLWNAKRFTASSNLRGNLWSGQLRDWQSKGIIKAEISIYPKPTNQDVGMGLDFNKCKHLSILFNIPFNEFIELDYEYEIEGSGANAQLVITFSDINKIDVLQDIAGIDISTKQVKIPHYELGFPI